MARLASLLLVLLSALAGCSGANGPSPFDATRDASSSPPAAAAPAGAAPEPVDISDGGDMLQPGSKDFTWDVAPGTTTFRVSVDVVGAQGAPDSLTTDFGYKLVGGRNATSYAEQQAGTISLNGGGGSCEVCFDGADAENPGDLVGSWKLHLEWGPSASHYDVSVTAHY